MQQEVQDEAASEPTGADGADLGVGLDDLDEEEDDDYDDEDA